MNEKLLLAVGAILFLFIRKAKGSPGHTPFPVDHSQKRGVRNNNPGNIKISSSPWLGKVPVEQNSDGVFEQFWEYKYGIRAMIKLIMNYIASGHNTVRKIITRYAPSSENPTSKYIEKISEWTGYSPDQTLSPTLKTFRRLIPAMARFETAPGAITESQVSSVWEEFFA